MQHKPRKNKNIKPVGRMHWAAHFVIKYGTLLSLCILIIGFFFPQSSFLAVSLCRTSVYSFAISTIGGLMFDVVALRRGMRE